MPKPGERLKRTTSLVPRHQRQFHSEGKVDRTPTSFLPPPPLPPPAFLLRSHSDTPPQIALTRERKIWRTRSDCRRQIRDGRPQRPLFLPFFLFLLHRLSDVAHPISSRLSLVGTGDSMLPPNDLRRHLLPHEERGQHFNRTRPSVAQTPDYLQTKEECTSSIHRMSGISSPRVVISCRAGPYGTFSVPAIFYAPSVLEKFVR